MATVYSSQTLGRAGTNQARKKRRIMALLAGLICLAMLLTSLILFIPIFRAHAETPTQRPTMGLNLGEPDADTFTDAMKTSGTWSSGSNAATVDANGWPTEDASLYVWQGQSKKDGTYQLSFTGQATLQIFGITATINNQQYNATSNTTTATIVISDTSNANFDLSFSNTQRTASSGTNTGVTNVVLMKPVSEGSTTTYDPSTIFTPYVAQAVAPYTYLRFMFGTNWNKSTNWSDRTIVGDASQYKLLPGENGFEGNQIAFEYMVKIANDNNKDLYIVVPDRANDDYLTKLAQLLLYGSDGVNPYTSPQSNPVWAPLKPNLNLYVEYTNEAWNFQFDQAHDLYDGPIGAQQEIKNNPNSPLIFDGNTDGNVVWQRNYANRALNVSKIFRSVFGDSAMGTRVRPLLFWQYSNLNNTAENELLFLNDYYNNADGIQHVSDPHPISYYFWGGGGAVYFNSNNDSASSVDALYASGIPQDSYQNMIDIEARWARSYGLHFMSYEGSWGISGTVGDQGRVDPRAKQALIDSFNDFVKAGGENYTVGTFGQWDDFKTASSYPLVQAAAVINASNYSMPAITQGLEVSASNPTIIGGPHYSFTRSGLSGAATNLGNETGYLLRVDASGSYQVSVNVGNAASGGQIGVYADGALLSTISVPNTGSNSSYQTVVAGSTSFTPGLHSIILRGKAQSSGNNAGTVNALLIQPGTGTPPAVPGAGPLPSGWQDQDIGSVGQAGSASLVNGTLSVTASGYDISGTADAFNFVYKQVTGDATIIARTTWLGDSNPYAKVGVMIRSSLDASAANAITYYSPAGDTTFQERTTNGGNTSHGTPPQLDLPTWLKLVRSGTTITGYISHDGNTWTQEGTDTFAVSDPVYVGVAVDAHNNNVLVTGDVDNISLNGTPFGTGATPTPTATPGTTPTPSPTPGGSGSLPSPWKSQDVGSVGQSGSSSYNNGTFTVAGSGADIWAAGDGFQYAYQSLSGDGTIIARVASEQNTDGWAKAGVMVRESLDAGSTFADMVITPGNGAAFQRRTSTGGSATHTAGSLVSAPYWVKLVRSGNTFTGSISSDGTNWTQVGSDTISMASNVYIGLAVTAHNNSALNTSTFDNVSVTGGSTTWTKCADENGICTFSGTHQVRYGANGHYNYQTATNSIACNNATFGDPIVGTVKECDYQ